MPEAGGSGENQALKADAWAETVEAESKQIKSRLEELHGRQRRGYMRLVWRALVKRRSIRSRSLSYIRSPRPLLVVVIGPAFAAY